MTTIAAVQPKVSPFRLFGQRKMAALVLLGFASGLPLFLTSRTLQAWMTREGVDLTTIGLFSLVALPYSLKFLWAPVVDRFIPPFLGRRRGWLLITQVLLLVAIAAMSLQDPRAGLQLLAINALVIAFLSASQDIVGDAYRSDVLDQREVGAGASVWVLGYRIALIVTGSLAFILADRIPWPMVYVALSMLMIVGMVTSFWAPEPVLRDAPPRNLTEAVYLPFREFFTRPGTRAGFALVILLFVIFYRYADYLAGNMTTPFLLQIGFSQSEIGVILGGIGLGATIAGVLIGGAIIGWIGLNRSLWIFLALQATTNLVYYWLAVVGANRGIMTVAIVIENVTAGLVTAVLLGYLMVVCDKRFSATQFALLSSLTAASRDIIVAPAGWMADALGWPVFFVATIAAALPAFVLLPFIAPWNSDTPRGAAAHTGETQ
jgi:PAT family beta-lactamase induction signal transducer AmpG